MLVLTYTVRLDLACMQPHTHCSTPTQKHRSWDLSWYANKGYRHRLIPLGHNAQPSGPLQTKAP